MSFCQLKNKYVFKIKVFSNCTARPERLCGTFQNLMLYSLLNNILDTFLKSVLFSDLNNTLILPGRCVSMTVVGLHDYLIDHKIFCFNLNFTLNLLQYIKYECMYLMYQKCIEKKNLLEIKFEQGWDSDSEIQNNTLRRIFSLIQKKSKF